MLIFMIILFLINNNHKDHKKKFYLFKFLLILGCISISLKPFF